MESSESVVLDVALVEGVCHAVDERERRAGIVLAPESSSLSAARRFVSSMLSNAVRHAVGSVGLELALLDGEELRVQARDESPDRPVIRRSSPDGIGGHGLTIIESLARRWGVELHEGFKVVWFEIPVSPRAR